VIHADVAVHKNRIQRITVTGHAMSAEYGRDLVCAEVSAVCTGLCNAVDEAGYSVPMTVEPGHVVIDAAGSDSHDLQVILKTGVTQLKTIEQVHSDYLKVTMMEV
jgi:hypothetical protein